ncbi:MAG: transcription antitermination protein NusB, partial [Planktomarina sp.]
MSISNLSGNQKRRMRSASRLYAVQALFQMEAIGQVVDQVISEFEDHRFGASYDEIEYEDGNIDHFRHVVAAAVNHQAKIDQMTDRALVAKWPIGRIDPTLRALFRAAGAELVENTAPAKVVIAEYMDVATAFF